jgi:hypothetical protein
MEAVGIYTLELPIITVYPGSKRNSETRGIPASVPGSVKMALKKLRE